MTDTTLIDSDQSSSQPKDRSSHGGYDHAPVPGPPIGYGWNPGNGPQGSSPYYPPHPSQQYPPPASYGPSESEPPASSSKKRLSKGKEKEKDAVKGKSRSNKEKTTTRKSPPKAIAHAESGSGGSQGSTGSFRAQGYVHDPSPGPVPMPSAGFFPTHYPRDQSPAGSDTPLDRGERRGHDRQRDKTSSRRSRQEPQYPGYPPPPPGYPPYPPPYPYPYPYGPPAAAAYSSQDTDYPKSSQSTHARDSPMSQDSPRSQRSGPSVASSDDPKKPRMVTLLINDKRVGSIELAEVRVPLKPTNEGFWADARELSRELQGSASKIDGPARVYAMRGRYKQVFLRVATDGEETFTSANLKIGTDKTVEVFIEYIAPFARAGFFSPRSESITSGSLKRRRSFDAAAEEPYANPLYPSPSHASTNFSPEPSPSLGPSRESSPMAVEDPPSQETHQSGTTEEARSRSDMSASRKSMSVSDAQGSGSLHQEPAPRSLFASQSPVDTSPPPLPTPQVKSTPKARPSTSSSVPSGVQTTPTAPPPAKKVRRHEDVDFDIEETEPPSARGQTTIAPATGFAGYINSATRPSSFSTPGFAGFSGASSSFGTQKSTAGPSLPTSSSSGFPRASAAQTPLDMAVSKYLKGTLSKEPEWKNFQEARNRPLTVKEQVEQYRYLQSKLDEYIGDDIPAEVEGASGTITKEQVMRAFGLSASKAEECKEVLNLTDLYGPNGTVTHDPEAVKMFNEPSPISTNIQIGRYLTLLRGIHNRWMGQHQ